MARWTQILPKGQRARFEPEEGATRRLEGELQWELEMMFSDRHTQEVDWLDNRRQYAAIPRMMYRNTPVPNAPNIEVPLGAIASDALTAQMTTVLYSGQPLLTARAVNEDFVEKAKAVQRWVNYLATQEIDLRLATDHAFNDCVQLGTSAYYVPYTKRVVNNRLGSRTWFGPQVIPIATENILFIGGSRGRIQDDRWVAVRWWLDPGEFRLWAREMGWDWTKAMPAAQVDWVRRQHELLAGTNSSNAYKEQFEIIEFFKYHDYHEDGVDLDMHIYYDRSSQRVLSVDLNEYDERPLVPMRYQTRPHLGYGLGVMSMLRPFQMEATEVHNARVLNMLIANTRHWLAVDGQVPDNLEVWPNKVTFAKDINGLKEMPMGDIYPSSAAAEEIVDGLASRRVGTDGTIGSGAAAPHSIGTRTPGITAMSTMQAQSARFTPAFDSMRLATCEALRQCLLRQREQLMTGDTEVSQQLAQHMVDVLGDDDAMAVADLLKTPDFDRYVAVEFTALSPQTNAAADQQAMMQLWQTEMQMYYTPAFQLLQAVSQPGTPPAVIDAATQIIEKATELNDRVLRTYDQTRDPSTFMLDLGDAMDALKQGAAQDAQTGAAVHGIAKQLLGGPQQGGQGGDQGGGQTPQAA